MSRYANMDHAGWLEDHLGRKFDRFQTRVVNIIGIVGGGIYNTPINWKSANWKFGGRGVAVNWTCGNGFATWDFDMLTKLVLLAHAECIRVELEATAPRLFKVVFFEREREGDIARRHPTIAQAVAAFEQWHRPLDRWFKEPAAEEALTQ